MDAFARLLGEVHLLLTSAESAGANGGAAAGPYIQAVGAAQAVVESSKVRHTLYCNSYATDGSICSSSCSRRGMGWGCLTPH